jgi:hypothetical protein
MGTRLRLHLEAPSQLTPGVDPHLQILHAKSICRALYTHLQRNIALTSTSPVRSIHKHTSPLPIADVTCTSSSSCCNVSQSRYSILHMQDYVISRGLRREERGVGGSGRARPSSVSWLSHRNSDLSNVMEDLRFSRR